MPCFLMHIFQLAHLLCEGFRGAVCIFIVVRECGLEFRDTETGENIVDGQTVSCGAAKACGIITNSNLVLTMVKVGLELYISNIQRNVPENENRTLQGQRLERQS